MSDKVLLIFVKNILLGKVKTRLAKEIGDVGAFEVYKKLVELTEKESIQLSDCDIRVYFSDVIIKSKWPNQQKYVQEGEHLGERMHNAFKTAFKDGYSSVIGIGSDLPDLRHELITEGFEKLKSSDTVFGPSEDGGYYLLGMNKLHDCIFTNKSWSTDLLMKETEAELNQENISISFLEVLNDVDTLEDLRNSSVSTKFEHLYELSRGNK